MSNEESNTVEKFYECALSNDKHYLKDAVLLSSCKHYACQSCFSKYDKDLESVKCSKCDVETQRKEIKVDDEVCEEIRKALKADLCILLSGVEKSIRETMSTIRNRLTADEDRIGIHIEYIREEVEIRVESLKIELDKLHETFKEEIDDLEKNLINNQIGLKKEVTSRIENGEIQLGKLKGDLEKNTFESIEPLYTYENELKELRRLVVKMEFERYHLSFNISNVEISKQMIGHLSWHNGLLDKAEIGKRLKTWSYQVINLDTEPNDLCILPTNELALINSSNDNITVFDKEFNLLKTIDKAAFSYDEFKPLRMTTNNKDRLYVTNYTLSEVIMLDLEFNKLKTFGTTGTESNQFDYCNGIAYHKGKIYVTDTFNNRIQVLNEELEYERSIALEYEPWIIKISTSNVVCVTRFDESGIYFYDLETFTLKNFYDSHGYGRISEINSYFIESCHNDLIVYVYEKDGTVFDKIDTSRYEKYLNSMGDGIFVFYNGELIVSAINEKKLLKF